MLLLWTPGSGAGQGEPQAAGTGVGLQFAVGSMGGGVLLTGSLTSWLGGRAGLHAMPRRFRATYGGLDYTASFPSPSFLLGADVHPGGGSFRVSAGALLLLDQVVLETGDLLTARGDESVVVGENPYAARRVGRLEATAEGRAVVPWVGAGWGGNATSGRVHFFAEGGVALWGEPGVTLVALGAERGNPDFQTDLELDRRAMQNGLSRFGLYPLLLVGVSLPIVSPGPR